jgi:hypothetical protein
MLRISRIFYCGLSMRYCLKSFMSRRTRSSSPQIRARSKLGLLGDGFLLRLLLTFLLILLSLTDWTTLDSSSRSQISTPPSQCCPFSLGTISIAYDVQRQLLPLPILYTPSRSDPRSSSSKNSFFCTLSIRFFKSIQIAFYIIQVQI